LVSLDPVKPQKRFSKERPFKKKPSFEKKLPVEIKTVSGEILLVNPQPRKKPFHKKADSGAKIVIRPVEKKAD
jgi:hypothetical protein